MVMMVLVEQQNTSDIDGGNTNMVAVKLFISDNVKASFGNSDDLEYYMTEQILSSLITQVIYILQIQQMIKI